MPRMLPSLLLVSLSTSAALARRGGGRAANGPCDPREFYDEEPDKPEHYWQCVPAVKQVGEWRLERCPEGQFFAKRVQKCISKSLRRQYLPSPGCSPTTNCPQPLAAQPCAA